MKKSIGRTLFWFKDKDEKLNDLGNRFFALATLLNRLLNEKYEGKKIQFINIDFCSQETYNMFPTIPVDYTHYYGGHLQYHGLIDYSQFRQLTYEEQNNFIWIKGCEYLQRASEVVKNNALTEAIEYAYIRGLEMRLNPDYRLVESEVVIYGQFMKASVWVNFKQDGMYSKLTLENDNTVIFEKSIDKTNNGIEFFLEIYKSIEAKENTLTIKGSRDVKYLPLSLFIEESFIIHEPLFGIRS
jgi:hypothetical protein